MDRDPQTPWDPREPVQLSPTAFETLVLNWLKRAAEEEKQLIAARHLGVVKGFGGDYRIDVLVSFTVFRGAEFIVLVECKHQGRPVEREDAMVLEAKLRDVGAHKGMLFSTSGFQRGALRYAREHKLATIAVVRGKWLYVTRAEPGPPSEPPPWAGVEQFSGVWTSDTGTGVLCHTIDMGHPDALFEWLRAQVSA